MADAKKQEARFAVKDKKDFDLGRLKEAVEKSGGFEVGKVTWGEIPPK